MSTSLLPTQPFRANRFVQDRQIHQFGSQTDVSFEKAIEALEKYLEQKSDTSNIEYLIRKKEAIRGEPAAKASFIRIIHDFLRENPEIQSTKYPAYYPNLPEALFQHHLGFGPMSVWFANPTESATVNGTQILFGRPGQDWKEVQPFSFDSIDQVKKLVRSITIQDHQQQITETQNWAEVDMYDGTRVTIFTPPMYETYTIIFRQYKFKEYTFEHEAERGTIPLDSVKWFKLLSQLMVSILTTGVRRSGKTTLLKVIAGARDPNYDVLTVERGSFEVHMRRDFPKRASHVIAAKASPEQMSSMFPAFLRSDAHYIMIPEIRSIEVDLAIQSRERGNGWLGSYHSQFVLNIPLELADLSLEVRPNRNHRSTYIRTAQSLDVVITMREDKTGRKIVTGVYAYEYDHETESFSVTTWMKYHRASDSWTFNAQVPSMMRERLEETSDYFQEFMSEFDQLARKHPFEGEAVKTVRIGG